MQKTTTNQIKEVLKKINIRAQDPVIFVHSGLFPFGIIEGGLNNITELLFEWVGSSGTIIMPTFTFKGGSTWNQSETRSETGVLTEYFRKLPEVYRTIHPLHSVSAYGKLANILTCDIEDSSFGPHSIFAKLYDPLTV